MTALGCFCCSNNGENLDSVHELYIFCIDFRTNEDMIGSTTALNVSWTCVISELVFGRMQSWWHVHIYGNRYVCTVHQWC